MKTWFAAWKWDQVFDKNLWIVHIRPTNVKWEYGFDFEKNVYISKSMLEIKQKDLIEKWDVLFNNTNSQELVWKTTFFGLEWNFFCSNHITRIKTNKKLHPKFLTIIFNLYQGKNIFFDICTNWNNQSWININVLKNIDIPVFSLEIQNEIVAKMDEALRIKQEKEAEAKSWLESIDAYVLGELGIEYEAVEEKKVFGLDLEVLRSERRFDPVYFIRTEREFKTSTYEIKELWDIAIIKKWQSITKEKLSEWNFPVIWWWQTSPYNNWVSNYSWNIITISASWAYSGFVWYHDYPIFASDCNVIFSKEEEKISTKFLWIFLRNRQKYIYFLQQGAGQPHVYASDLEKLEIPLPPFEIQKKIANEVQGRIERSKDLGREAREIYESAKNEVESMILES